MRSDTICSGAALEPMIRFAGRYVPGMKEMLLLTEFGLDITYGLGVILAGKLKDGCAKHGVLVELGCAASGLGLDSAGKVISVQLTSADTSVLVKRWVKVKKVASLSFGPSTRINDCSFVAFRF